MDDVMRWLEVATDILNAQQPEDAHARFVEALMGTVHADLATRVGLDPEAPEAIDITVSARTRVPPREHWPEADDARAHPLNQYYASSDDRAPVRLPDLLSDGWQLGEEARAAQDALGITVHQLALPCAPGPGEFDGWVLLNEDGFSDHDLERLTALQGLLVGLDRHIRQYRRLTAVDGSREVPQLLTPRERLVLALVAAGSTADGIAARLAISPRTVHKHQENLYRKLGAVDRLSAVLRGQELGLLPSGPVARSSMR